MGCNGGGWGRGREGHYSSWIGRVEGLEFCRVNGGGMEGGYGGYGDFIGLGEGLGRGQGRGR